MAYEVILTNDAHISLDNLVEYIERECDPEDVKRLSRELVNAVEALSDELAYLPYRNSICLKSKDGREYRQGFLCKFKYRVIYAIDEPTNTVVVSRVMSTRELLEDYEYEL